MTEPVQSCSAATEVVIEQSEYKGVVYQTIQTSDGREFIRELHHTCSICGAFSDRPFPRSAISCMRPECKDGKDD
jgi:hypothetical protein